jgi:hypothetical protein
LSLRRFSEKTDVTVKILYRHGHLLFAVLAAGLLFSGCEQPGGGWPETALPGSGAALQSLGISAGNLSPPFSAGITEYRAEVNHRVTAVTVTADPAGSGAQVSGTGRVSVNEGENTVAVTVRAAGGEKKTYTVTVRRLDGTVIPLASAADLAKIGRDEGCSLAGDYRLDGDVTLENWTPVAADADHAFSGSLDGGNHEITFRSFDSAAVSGAAYLGMFGYVKGADAARAEIKDLTVNSSIDAESAHASGQAAGLIAGYAENTKIKNITLKGSLKFKSAKNIYQGGVAGYIQRGTLVRECNSSMSMTVDGGSGGGLVSGMYYNFAGGFVGLFKDGGEIAGCHNTGTVTADCTTAESQVFCGGIAGGSYYAFTAAYQGKIEDCSSTGNITAKSRGDWSWAGGIAGCVAGDGDGTPENTTRIMRCFAGGTISTKDSGAEYPYAGGITGCNYYGALIAQSYFTGEVISNTDGNYTGGIAGYNSQGPGHTSRIEDCWSGGKVTGFHNAGGIVGQNQVNASVRRCHSIAEVSVTDTCETNKPTTNPGAGGIAGVNAGTEPDSISGCAALNPSIAAAAGTKIHRVAGWSTDAPAALGNNHAWSGMAIDPGAGSYTADTGAGKVDGADCAQKPAQSFYGGLGWDFAGVWKTGGNGYPVLQWQSP